MKAGGGALSCRVCRVVSCLVVSDVCGLRACTDKHSQRHFLLPQLKLQSIGGMQASDNINMPAFICDYMFNKYGMKRLVQVKLRELIASIKHFYHHDKRVGGWVGREPRRRRSIVRLWQRWLLVVVEEPGCCWLRE